jgi:hypothetical protein
LSASGTDRISTEDKALQPVWWHWSAKFPPPVGNRTQILLPPTRYLGSIENEPRPQGMPSVLHSYFSHKRWVVRMLEFFNGRRIITRITLLQ